MNDWISWFRQTRFHLDRLGVPYAVVLGTVVEIPGTRTYHHQPANEP